MRWQERGTLATFKFCVNNQTAASFMPDELFGHVRGIQASFWQYEKNATFSFLVSELFTTREGRMNVITQ